MALVICFHPTPVAQPLRLSLTHRSHLILEQIAAKYAHARTLISFASLGYLRLNSDNTIGIGGTANESLDQGLQRTGCIASVLRNTICFSAFFASHECSATGRHE